MHGEGRFQRDITITFKCLQRKDYVTYRWGEVGVAAGGGEVSGVGGGGGDFKKEKGGLGWVGQSSGAV